MNSTLLVIIIPKLEINSSLLTINNSVVKN